MRMQPARRLHGALERWASGVDNVLRTARQEKGAFQRMGHRIEDQGLSRISSELIENLPPRHVPTRQKPKELCGSGSVRNNRVNCPIAPSVCGVMRPAYASSCADMPPR